MDGVDEKLSIKTFFMGLGVYNDVSNTNKRLAQRYLETIKNDESVTSQYTIDYNAKIMGFFLKNIKTDLDKLTIDDIDDLQASITNWTRKNGQPVAATTKKQYRIGIKRFLHWAAERYEQPRYNMLAKQIKVSSKSVAPKKKPEELFTTAEIDKMIAAATELRDKAIIATLSESGCRRGELLNCKIKDVTFTEIGCNLTLDGKTGTRTVPLVFAAPFIDHYLRQHPLRNDSEKPLWVTKYRGGHSALTYTGLDTIVKKIGRAAGIKKRVHLHNFRHTAATQLAKVWTEPIMRTYLGWADNSTMPSIYISLSRDDMEAAVLSDRYGIVERKQISKDLEVGKCPKCWKTVAATATFCYNCGAPLTKDAQSSADVTAAKILNYFTQHSDMLATIAKNS